jgi:hypothetical protein
METPKAEPEPEPESGASLPKEHFIKKGSNLRLDLFTSLSIALW